MRLPIIASLEKLRTEDFQDPDAKIQDKKLGELVITDDSVASMLSQEAQAGRAVYLTVKVVQRLDGVFAVAGMIQPTGIVSQSAPPMGDKVDSSGATTG